MSYKVISRFKDIIDHNHIYEVGSVYPREGYTPDTKRVQELSSKENKIGEVLIEAIEETKAEAPKKRRTRKKAE